MTTAAQWAANRRNALKSTGPRTERGRKRVALNAQRHGLTSRPKPEVIIAHLRLILGDGTASPEAAQGTAEGRAALGLAVAEARLDSLREACATAECHTPHWQVLQIVALLSDLMEDDEASIVDRCIASGHREHLLELSNRADRNDLRALTRHTREAYGARKKALQKWLALRKNTKQSHSLARGGRQIQGGGS